MSDIEEIEFVFSFRSPYAWIAACHVLPMVDPAIRINWTPFMPMPSFRNFTQGVGRGKSRHNLFDILRLSKAYKLSIGKPPVNEDDWSLAHTAFLWARNEGKGPAFAMALMNERWVHSASISNKHAIARIAERVGLDPVITVQKASDPLLQLELNATIHVNYDDRDIFGVPMFILPTGEHFWGHDRMEWAIRYGYLKGVAKEHGH